VNAKLIRLGVPRDIINLLEKINMSEMKYPKEELIDESELHTREGIQNIVNKADDVEWDDPLDLMYSENLDINDPYFQRILKGDAT